MSLIYALFGLLDYAVYSIAAVLVRVIMEISTAEFFKPEQISNIVDKVYVIVGVLMLFKLVISAIQYMVNPDTFDDKEKGLGGLLKKTVISLALIVLFPVVFDFAKELQAPIIETLPKIILSDGDGSSSTNDVNEENVGNAVAYEVLKSFVSIKTNDNGTKKYDDPIGESSSNNSSNNGENSFNTFREHIADGCSFFDDGSKCHYNYMIIISTLCGGFLVYVLLSLVLDVAIRTIKMEVIKILAPIPISSYVYKKDSLNKFVKTASQVYADLFIRMAIIYFIIFAIQSLFNSDFFTKSYDDNFFLSLAVRVSLIFGLLMFAKNAPKFISELLGLPDIGSGEMKDMFTPAWQRAGGAAGAIINPARTAISNTRAAWKNNADMVDSRGGKLRRAMQRTRRVVNAGRHGMGGLAKGALDSVEGVMNGDNWSKMSQRHDAAKKRSDMRSAAGFMKRTDNDKRQAYKDRRKEIEKEFKKQGIDINAVTKKARKDAVEKVNGQIKGSQAKIDYLKKKLASGAGTSAERLQWANELKSEQARYNSLTSKDGYEKAVAAEMQTSMDKTLAMAYENKRKAAKEKEASNIERMRILRSELNDPSLQLSESERNKKADEWMRLSQENAEINAKYPSEKAAIDARNKIEKNAELMLSLREELGENYYKKQQFDSLSSQRAELEKRRAQFEDKKSKFGLSASEAEAHAKIISDLSEINTQITGLGYDTTRDAEVTKLMQEYNALDQENSSLAEIETRYRVAEQVAKQELSDQYDEQVKIKTEKLDKERDISGWTIAKGKTDAFFGGEGFTGKGYIDTADLLKNTRSSLYTGEAMTKMRQNADILVDASGQPATFTAKFTKAGVTTKITYADMADLKRKADNGTLSREELDKFGFENSSMIQSAFEDIEKQAADAYVTANMAAADPSVHSDIKLKGNAPANTTIVEGIKRMKAQIASSNIPKKVRDKLLNDLSENPGKFFKGASDVQEKMRTQGSRINAFNSGKKEGQ